MRTLNTRKLRWIMHRIEEGDMSIYRIAKTQGVTPRHIRRLYKRFKDVPITYTKLARSGRPPTLPSDFEINAVKEVKKDYDFGAVNIEKVLEEKGITISHNRIHSILLQKGLANNEPKKQKRRKWIRYERYYSNSLWHTDYHELDIGGYIIPFEDDASRFITGYGVFRNETAKNAVSVLERAVNAYGIPRQLVSDHGVQFTTVEREGVGDPGENEFQRKLRKYNIRHILARVKHPQTNGKIERWFGTIDRLICHFDGDVAKAVKFYNFERPHMSLNNGHLRTPYAAFLEKMRKNYKVTM